MKLSKKLHLFILASFLGLVVARLTIGDRFEYKWVDIETCHRPEVELNEAGAIGWEPLDFMPMPGSCQVLMKRRIWP